MPAKWLKADATVADAFVYKKLSATATGIRNLYLQFDVYVCPALLPASGQVTPDLFDVIDLYTDGSATFPETDPTQFMALGDPEGVAIGNAAGVYEWSTEADGSFGSPIATPSGAHTIGVHIKTSTPKAYEYVVDGTTYTLSTAALSGYIARMDIAAVGALASNFGAGDIVWISNVKIGTTAYGSTDILSDDFSSGTFAAWDGTSGTVSIAAAVTCGAVPAPGGVIFDTIYSVENFASFAPLNRPGSGVIFGGEGFRVDG